MGHLLCREQHTCQQRPPCMRLCRSVKASPAHLSADSSLSRHRVSKNPPGAGKRRVGDARERGAKNKASCVVAHRQCAGIADGDQGQVRAVDLRERRWSSEEVRSTSAVSSLDDSGVEPGRIRSLSMHTVPVRRRSGAYTHLLILAMNAKRLRD